MKKLLLMVWLIAASAVVTGEIVVINKGIGGNNTRAGLRRFKRDVLEQRPRFLVIYFGMNDAHNPNAFVELKEFKNNLRDMIRYAQENSINPILVTLNPINAEVMAKRKKLTAKELEKKNVEYDKAIREVADQMKVPLVDLRKVIEDNGGISMKKSCLVGNPANGRGNDGVHLVAKGYQLFGKAVADEIKKNYLKNDDIVVCLGDSITWGAGMKGAGTAYGDTYPAWLYVYLNNAISKKNKLTAPRPFPEGRPGNLIKNASFELTDVTGFPDLFTQNFSKNMSQLPIKSMIGPGTPDGKRYLKIAAKYGKTAEFWPKSRFRVKAGKKYSLRFSAKGDGQLQMRLRFYRPGDTALLEDLTGGWVKFTSEWKNYDFNFTPPIKSRVLLQIKCRGTVDLDDLYFGSESKLSTGKSEK